MAAGGARHGVQPRQLHVCVRVETGAAAEELALGALDVCVEVTAALGSCGITFGVTR